MIRMLNEPPAETDGSLLEIKWLPGCNPNANRSQWCFPTRMAALNPLLILLYVNYSMVRYRVHAGSVWDSNSTDTPH